MALTKGDLQKIGEVVEKKMDERLLKFSNEVTEPAVGRIVETAINEAKEELTNHFDGQIAKLERKLDQVTDHHSEKLDDHEKRIGKLEVAFAS